MKDSSARKIVENRFLTQSSRAVLLGMACMHVLAISKTQHDGNWLPTEKLLAIANPQQKEIIVRISRSVNFTF